ncbi:MAG: M23 family metallopeptidase [Anaerolineaceae bacterium]
MHTKRFFFLLLTIALSGCSVQTPPTISPSPLVTNTPIPVDTLTPIVTITPTATSIPLLTGIVSPLQGIPLSDLHLITSNPYVFNYPFNEGSGNNKNHPAIDLGFYTTKSIQAYQGPELNTDDGFPIQAILPGKVVNISNNKFPYGNMIMIETPLQLLSPDLIATLQMRKPYTDEDIKLHSTCQPDQTRISWSVSSQSVYALYAHMKDTPVFQPGDKITAGEILGGIGATGNSNASIEHLHLEVRVGPSNAQFGTISTYISTASEEERYNYCIWALSEVFLPINPALFWDPSNSQGQ